MPRRGQKQVGSKDKGMVRRKRGSENVSPSDASSPKACPSCPAAAKGGALEGENGGLCGDRPRRYRARGPRRGQSRGRAEHPGTGGTVQSPSNSRPQQKVQIPQKRMGLRGKDPLPGLAGGQAVRAGG